MYLSIYINKSTLRDLSKRFRKLQLPTIIVAVSTILAIAVSLYALANDAVIAYGDAESHLNIAKRVVHSITPGLAQLGGIWLPLPHLLLVPFVYFDTLWRTGLAGSIVSGVAYVISALYLFKISMRLIPNRAAGLLAALIFMFNPNILYLQTTPMTEIPLIAFFILSSYYFVIYLQEKRLTALIGAAFFGFCATLSRYDGWFLVLAQALIVVLMLFPFSYLVSRLEQMRMRLTRASKSLMTGVGPGVSEFKKRWQELEGSVVIYSTLAFFGILLWLGWDGLILGDPLYFTHSEFSAKSQQQGWLAVGQLPAYKNLWRSFIYYFITSMSNVGVTVFGVAIAGLFMFLLDRKKRINWSIAFVLLSPFIFYVITLYMGQSIIFIPHLTPPSYDWQTFNVRYGLMMVPAAAFFVAFLFNRMQLAGKAVIIIALLINVGLFAVGFSKVITYDDGVNGLSHSKRVDAELWLRANYDDGLVLLDDFSRLTSIIRSGIPMQNVIYVGNKPYWEDSLVEPEKHATWIILQKDDLLWKEIWDPLYMQERIYAHFTKVYTSPEILIFKKTPGL